MLFSHQLPLDAEDSLSGCLTVALLARDDDHLRVAVLCWQVDLGVGLLPDLSESAAFKCDGAIVNEPKQKDAKADLFDVGASFSNDVFVKLLEDGNGQREAVLDLPKGGKKREESA